MLGVGNSRFDNLGNGYCCSLRHEAQNSQRFGYAFPRTRSATCLTLRGEIQI